MVVKVNWWNVINSKRHVKCARAMIVDYLLTSWQSMLDFVQWHPQQERECVKPLQIEILATSRSLRWEQKQLNIPFNLIGWLDWV